MTHTAITISDSYNGQIEQLFNLEFQTQFHELAKSFELSRTEILSKRNIKLKSSTEEYLPVPWVETIEGLSKVINENQEIICLKDLAHTEKNFCIDGRPVSAGLLELFAVLYHTKKRTKKLTCYIPNCESSAESNWWNNLLIEIQNLLGMSSNLVSLNFLFESTPTTSMENLIQLEIPTVHAIHKLNDSLWSKVI
jgi:malate synthase